MKNAIKVTHNTKKGTVFIEIPIVLANPIIRGAGGASMDMQSRISKRNGKEIPRPEHWTGDGLITISEAAKKVKYSEATIYALIKKGTLTKEMREGPFGRTGKSGLKRKRVSAMVNEKAVLDHFSTKIRNTKSK